MTSYSYWVRERERGEGRGGLTIDILQLLGERVREGGRGGLTT